MRHYAGIGSRKTPARIIKLMQSLASAFSTSGYVLRSGAADGADLAFETGCKAVNGPAEIWLPWRGFNQHADTKLYPTPAHMSAASEVHPAWSLLGQGPQKLHARNVGQVLGADCATPVSFVACWTADGCESEATRTRDTGGTGTAIVLASRRGIPVFNLANASALSRLIAHVAAETPGFVFSPGVAVPSSTIADGINIWSGATGLGGALTNMTVLAKSKGGIQQEYPVVIGSVTYEDSEAAYQSMKIPGQPQYNDSLMVDIISAKLAQHPRLLSAITKRGGVAWLELCEHFTGAKSARFQAWEGIGVKSRFIANLINGYRKAMTGVGPRTHVVHVSHAPYDVYIGRANPTHRLPESIWHNPHKDGGDRVARFHEHLLSKPELLALLSALAGKTLGCWCKSPHAHDTPCHGDVLAALADGREWPDTGAQSSQGKLF